MLLLDTNALLWLSGGSDRLGRKARSAIRSAIGREAAAFSAISMWEAALLIRKGRYALVMPVERWRTDLLDAGLREAPLDGAIATASVAFDGLGDDPADRFIAATALHLAARLVTSDQKLLDWATGRGLRPVDARA